MIAEPTVEPSQPHVCHLTFEMDVDEPEPDYRCVRRGPTGLPYGKGAAFLDGLVQDIPSEMKSTCSCGKVWELATIEYGDRTVVRWYPTDKAAERVV